MLSLKFWPALATLISLPLRARGDVTLFIPGLDEQPLSANELSVDEAGRTAWEIVAGTQTGGAAEATFTGTATLVEGPSDVRITFEDTDGTDVEISCAIQATDLAFCSGERGFSITPINLGEVTPFTLQGGPLATSTGATPASSAFPIAAPASATAFSTLSVQSASIQSTTITVPPSSATVISALASATTSLSSVFNPGQGPLAGSGAIPSRRPLKSAIIAAIAVFSILTMQHA